MQNNAASHTTSNVASNVTSSATSNATQAPPPSADPTTEMDVRHDAEAREKVVDLVKRARFAMFGTYDASGNNHSRPMAAVSHETGEEGAELWFFCRSDSRKAREIGADPRVTIDYCDDSNQNYVSVLGRAEVVDDRAKADQLWMEPLRTWFPEGTEDPALRLIRVDMETAEYWDSPSSMVVHGFGYLKAAITGEPPAPGDIAQVKM